MSKSCCCCDDDVNFVFPCSGGADVGELADRAAREISKQGIAKVSCLAGIGGDVSGIIQSTRSSSKIVVIDGCPVECAKKTLENKGFDGFFHIQLQQENFYKGKTQINDSNINKIVNKTKELLR